MKRSEHRAAPPESYVVRVYRRDARWPTRIAGTVEIVGSDSELSFRSLRELQRILARQDPLPDERGRAWEPAPTAPKRRSAR